MIATFCNIKTIFRIVALKDNIKQLLCVFSFLLTIIAFAVWMTEATFTASATIPTPLFIAGSW